MSFHGRARHKFILGHSIPHRETSDGLIFESIRDNRKATTPASLSKLAVPANFTGRLVRPYLFLSPARRDVNIPEILRVTVKDVAKMSPRRTNNIIAAEVRALLEYSTHYVDSVVFSVPDGQIPGKLTSLIGELQTAGKEVAFYSEGVSKRSSAVCSTYQAALELLRKETVLGRSNKPLGFLSAHRRPGLHGATLFLEPTSDIFEDQTSRCIPAKFSSYFYELKGIIQKYKPAEVVVFISSAKADKEFLLSTMFAVENSGGHCVFLTKDGKHLPEILPELKSHLARTKPAAFLALKSLANSPKIKSPANGWEFFNRPDYDENIRGFRVPGPQEDNYFAHVIGLDVCLRDDLLALAKVGAANLVIDIGNNPIDEHTNRRLYEILSKPIRKQGGLLLIKTTHMANAAQDKVNGGHFEVCYSEDAIKSKVDKHIAIAPPQGSWRYISRPERTEPNSKFLRTKIADESILTEDKTFRWLQGTLEELRAMQKVNCSGVIVHAPGDNVSGTVISKFELLRREFNRAGLPMTYCVESDRLYSTMRNHQLAPLCNSHKNEVEAMLDMKGHLRAPSKGWNFFSIDWKPDLPEVLVLSMHDPHKANLFFRGDVGYHKVSFFPEIKNILDSSFHLVINFPKDLGFVRQPGILAIKHLQKEMDDRGKVVVGIYPDVDSTVLDDLSFPPEEQYLNVQDALYGILKKI